MPERFAFIDYIYTICAYVGKKMDFLENAWIGNDNNGGAADDYRRMFSTQFNQVGRCFPGEKGQLGASGM